MIESWDIRTNAQASSAATVQSGRTVPATEWTLVETSLSQREFDLFVTDGTQVSPASRLREDTGPSVVQEWVSTPVDCEASWIDLILDAVGGQPRTRGQRRNG